MLALPGSNRGQLPVPAATSASPFPAGGPSGPPRRGTASFVGVR